MRTDHQAVREWAVRPSGCNMPASVRGAGGTETGAANVNGETAEDPQTGQKSLADLREAGAAGLP